MAAPLVVWTSSMENTGRDEERGSIVSREPEASKRRGRKRSKSNGSSETTKQPRRGLGVAHLERLRQQEQWKRITEVAQVEPQNLHYHNQFQFPFSFPDQQSRISSLPSTSDGAFCHGQASSQGFLLHPYRIGNGGFSGNGVGSGVGAIFPDQFQMDRLFQTGKELSSTQTMHCWPDQCDICLKVMKRINDGYKYDIATAKNPEIMPMDGYDFLGFNLLTNRTIDGRRRDFDMGGVRPAGYSVPDVPKEVEVGESLLMEYEFFPREGGRSITHNSNNNGGCSSNTNSSFTEVAVAGEASPATNTTNFLDLSLKLSY